MQILAPISIPLPLWDLPPSCCSALMLWRTAAVHLEKTHCAPAGFLSAFLPVSHCLVAGALPWVIALCTEVGGGGSLLVFLFCSHCSTCCCFALREDLCDWGWVCALALLPSPRSLKLLMKTCSKKSAYRIRFSQLIGLDWILTHFASPYVLI